MTALWTAAKQVGAAISGADNVAYVRMHLPGPRPDRWTRVASQLNNDVFAGYRSVRGQLLTIGWALQTFDLGAGLASTAEGAKFVVALDQVFKSSALLIEWIRSRITGYPRLLVPHVDTRGPYSDHNLMPGVRFPWIAELRKSGLQLAPAPPGISGFGSGASSTVVNDIIALLDALRRTPEWQTFDRVQRNLPSSGLGALRVARDEFWKATSEDVILRNAGTRIVRRAQYIEYALRRVQAGLPPDALSVWSAFERLDSLLEDTWRVIAEFALRSDHEQVTQFSGVEWEIVEGRTSISTLSTSPWAYEIGSIVSIPPSVLPSGVCGVIEGQTLSFREDLFPVQLRLKVLDGGWPTLSH